ncbi:unnamed protein product [Rotaria sp. Silwood1]|nr:unnamed protein product [Rotaria sp. Silwood1]
MQAIHDEKCIARISTPISFRDILLHVDRKKNDLTSLTFSALEIPITPSSQACGLTENTALLTSNMWADIEDRKHLLRSLERFMQRLKIKVANREGNTVYIGQLDEI